jgi:hypothetical protein
MKNNKKKTKTERIREEINDWEDYIRYQSRGWKNEKQ